MNLKKLDECRQAFTAAEAAAYDSLGNVINAAALQDQVVMGTWTC